jgi:H/ACA ribonucleoprotein complex subunit 4
MSQFTDSLTESAIEHHEEVVLMTTKGEAIALGIAQMSTVEMSTCDHGVVAKVKRCIMERDLYPRRWGLGPVALEKKKLKADGKLDKYGRPNDATPAKWSSEYKDFSTSDASAAAAAAAPAKASEAEDTPMEEAATPSSPAADDSKDKKRKKHDGETAEEKAERKRRKAEKKAAKAAKKAAKGEAMDSDSD